MNQLKQSQRGVPNFDHTTSLGGVDISDLKQSIAAHNDVSDVVYGGAKDNDEAFDNIEDTEQEDERPKLPILSPEEVRERRELINYIKSYLIHPRIGKLLGEFRAVPIEDMTIEELKVFEEDISRQINTGVNSQFGKIIFQGTTGVLETLGPKLGLQCQGLQAVLCSNPEVDLIIDHLTLKHQNSLNQSPEVKLGLIILIAAKTLDTVNRQKMATSEFLNKPVNSAPDEFKNL